MIVVLLAVIFRMFIPFEFSYTKSIWIEGILSPFRKVLIFPVLIEPVEIKAWHILVVLWGISAGWGLIHKIYLYKNIIRYVSLLPEQQWDGVLRKYGLDKALYDGIEGINLVYSDRFTSPCLIGLRHPYIVLPEISYEKEQFRYIILHEIMHVRNNDIKWKIIIDLLCTVFWWNPVFRYLKKELFQLIEIRNDLIIVKELSDKQRIAYMVCLRDTAVHLAGEDFTFGVSFSRSNFKGLKRRMEMIAEGTNFSRSYQVVLYVGISVLLIMSSAVIIEPYRPIETNGEMRALTLEDMYLMENGDQYDVYVFGNYMMTIDKEDAEYFQNVQIYEASEDSQEIEEIEKRSIAISDLIDIFRGNIYEMPKNEIDHFSNDYNSGLDL